MNRSSFEAAYSPHWDHLETQLAELGKRRRDPTLADFPARYRQLCQHLALARARGYGSDLELRLNQLVLRCHQYLYRGKAGGWSRALHLLTVSFPRTVRCELRLFWLAAALMLLPALAMYAAVRWQPSLAYSLLSVEQVEEFDQMYREAGSVVTARPSESDFLMFGLYIFNNVGIAFRTFAGGVLAGIGSVFYLVFNGLFMGTLIAHLQTQGLHRNLLPFMVGHSAFELTGIVLAGMAGLRLGVALWLPGSKRRSASLRDAAHAMLPVIYGTMAFLVIAAFIEAYWSARPTTEGLRYGVGAVLWLLVAAFLWRAGAGTRPR